MASYPPSTNPNASTFNNQDYAGDNGMGLTYQQALKEFVAFPTTQSALITFPESINVGGQVECNSVLAQGLNPQLSIKPTGVSAPPTLTYQEPVIDGVLSGLLSSSYIYTPEMTDVDIGSTNPNVLITKGYADATYTAGTGTYATLDLDNEFTGFNNFTEATTFTGIGSNSSAVIITQTDIPTTGSVINMLANNTAGAYNQIVHSGDASLYSTTDNGVGTGALCLTTWNDNVSGVRVNPTGVQLAGEITGGVSNIDVFKPIQFTSAQTTGNNPIAEFVPTLNTNSKLSVYSDPTAGQFSSQTTAGDLVLSTSTFISPAYSPYTASYRQTGLPLTQVLLGAITPSTAVIVAGQTLIDEVSGYQFTLITDLGSYVWDCDWYPSIPTTEQYGTGQYDGSPEVDGGGVIEICSQGASSIRIGPSSINANTPIYTPAVFNTAGLGLNLVPVMPTTTQDGAGTGLLWNQDEGSYGETDFLNYAQLGTGGFVFWNTSSVAVPQIIARIAPAIPLTSNDLTLATTFFVNNAISNIPASTPTYFTLSLPNATLISNITIVIPKTGGTFIQTNPAILSARLMYGTNYNGVDIISTLDFTATIIIGTGANSGIITQNFNITTAGAPTINITPSSMSVDANHQISLNMVLTSPTTLNFYQAPVVLSNYSFYTTCGYTYGHPTLGYS